MEKIIRKMGRYALVDKLGQGSMGVVYKAYDEMLDRYVALKTMASDMTFDTDLRKRFYQEARLAAKLNHPYIITVFDLGEADGQLYIAMELLAGKDLRTFLKEGQDCSLEQKIDWMIQLADAFAFAHQEGIIHRDIKPGNIHIRENGELVVMDFGIARAATSDITRAGAIIGTPEYISPEQILAIRVDHRADIFSLGLVFYELLTGVHPFRSPNLPATIHKVLNHKPTPPVEMNPTIPLKLSDLIMKAMEKDVNNRYQDCNRLLDELLLCKEELSRQARNLVKASESVNSELVSLIARLQDLYGRADFLAICAELGYDPSSGQLSGPVVPSDPSHSQSSEIYMLAQQRLQRAHELIENSAQVESLMKTGKAHYAAGQYQQCMDQMNIILAYYPEHELASEYIQQCDRRLQEQKEVEERRHYIMQVEQNIMNLFQSGQLTHCQREAMQLLQYDPSNTIATKFLQKCEDKIRTDQQKALQRVEELQDLINRAISLRTKGELRKALDLFLQARKMDPDSPDIAREIQITEQEIRAGDEYLQTIARPKTPAWLYPSVGSLGVAIIVFIWWLLSPSTPYSAEQTQEILNKAKQQMNIGELDQSLRTLEDYIAKDPYQPEALQLLSDVKKKIAEQLALKEEEKIKAMVAEARKLEAAGEFEKAIASYEAVLKLQPLNQTAQNGLANSRVRLASTATEEKLRQEIESRYSAAENDLQAGRYGPAKFRLEQILQLDPENQKAKQLLARVTEKLQKIEEEPSGKVRDLLSGARAEIQRRNYEKASTLLNQAEGLDPQNSELKSLRAQLQAEAAKPRFGSITINCEPFGTAYIDGQPIGETPIPLRKIRTGEHTITIRRDGYREVSRPITVREDQTQHLQFTLQKN